MGIAIEDNLLSREVDETAEFGRDGGAAVRDRDEERIPSVHSLSSLPAYFRDPVLMLFLTALVWGHPLQKCSGRGYPAEMHIKAERLLTPGKPFSTGE
ncbi:hypothetical protein MchiMG62_15020 [Methanoculleus chikugoensis]|uniref:Uncharacterized protein n=1 Tax=Methanoculleus chikugoensis TaxID=118126 RepID=A0ABM7H695_9EURY|nr:hypothetical protein MchiMG62_15020 [Methanoculleus chikugoensis]